MISDTFVQKSKSHFPSIKYIRYRTLLGFLHGKHMFCLAGWVSKTVPTLKATLNFIINIESSVVYHWMIWLSYENTYIAVICYSVQLCGLILSQITAMPCLCYSVFYQSHAPYSSRFQLGIFKPKHIGIHIQRMLCLGWIHSGKQHDQASGYIIATLAQEQCITIKYSVFDCKMERRHFVRWCFFTRLK